MLPIPSEDTTTSAAGGSETMVTGCVDGLTMVAQPTEHASMVASSPRFHDVVFIWPPPLHFDKSEGSTTPVEVQGERAAGDAVPVAERQSCGMAIVRGPSTNPSRPSSGAETAR